MKNVQLQHRHRRKSGTARLRREISNQPRFLPGNYVTSKSAAVLRKRPNDPPNNGRRKSKNKAGRKRRRNDRFAANYLLCKIRPMPFLPAGSAHGAGSAPPRVCVCVCAAAYLSRGRPGRTTPRAAAAGRRRPRLRRRPPRPPPATCRTRGTWRTTWGRPADFPPFRLFLSSSSSIRRMCRRRRRRR